MSKYDLPDMNRPDPDPVDPVLDSLPTDLLRKVATGEITRDEAVEAAEARDE